jgi:hypothetical protein
MLARACRVAAHQIRPVQFACECGVANKHPVISKDRRASCASRGTRWSRNTARGTVLSLTVASDDRENTILGMGRHRTRSSRCPGCLRALCSLALSFGTHEESCSFSRSGKGGISAP